MQCVSLSGNVDKRCHAGGLSLECVHCKVLLVIQVRDAAYYWVSSRF